MSEQPGSQTATTALILCGGLGTRLRPVTGDMPKALVPVAGRPFLHYTLHYLKGQGLVDIILATGHGAEQIAATCGDGSRWGIRLRYSREPRPLGTAGAVKCAEGLVRSDPFLVLNGDSLLPTDLGRLARFHRERRARVSMILFEVEDRARFGGVRCAADGAIDGFYEKGRTGPGPINAGIYLVDCAVLRAIPADAEVSLERDVFPRLAGDGLYGLAMPGPFLDIGTPESYARAQEVFALWPGESRG